MFTRRHLFALLGSFFTGFGLKRSGVLRKAAMDATGRKRYIYGSIEVTAGAMKGQRGAFAAALDSELRGLRDGINAEAERAFRS